MRTRISSKGQVVIPREARERLGLTEGTELGVRLRGDQIVLHKVSPRGWREWQGAFRGLDLTGALDAEHRAERRRDAQGP